MIDELYTYFQNIIDKSDNNWVSYDVYDMLFNEKIAKLNWRTSNVTYSKYNKDDIILWHKGMPYCFIRYSPTNNKQYVNYLELEVDDECIIKFKDTGILYCINTNYENFS